MSKSYWMGVACRTQGQKDAIKRWFSPLCDDMTPESAEILIDKVTDREKKIRAVMVDKDGKRRTATRTKGGKTFSVTLGQIESDRRGSAA